MNNKVSVWLRSTSQLEMSLIGDCGVWMGMVGDLELIGASGTIGELLSIFDVGYFNVRSVSDVGINRTVSMMFDHSNTGRVG